MTYEELYESIEKAPELEITETAPAIEAIYTKHKGVTISFAIQNGVARGGIWGTSKNFRFDEVKNLDILLKRLGIRKGEEQ